MLFNNCVYILLTFLIFRVLLSVIISLSMIITLYLHFLWKVCVGLCGQNVWELNNHLSSFMDGFINNLVILGYHTLIRCLICDRGSSSFSSYEYVSDFWCVSSTVFCSPTCCLICWFLFHFLNIVKYWFYELCSLVAFVSMTVLK